MHKTVGKSAEQLMRAGRIQNAGPGGTVSKDPLFRDKSMRRHMEKNTLVSDITLQRKGAVFGPCRFDIADFQSLHLTRYAFRGALRFSLSSAYNK